MSDKQLSKAYMEAGAAFGDAVSYIYMGECIGFEELLTRWEELEAEWSRRGYQTFPIEEFVSLGGYGVPLKHFGSYRSRDGIPILHAKRYRDMYLGKLAPAVNFQKLLDGPQVVLYQAPHTMRPHDSESSSPEDSDEP